jgi:hypothetical protein
MSKNEIANGIPLPRTLNGLKNLNPSTENSSYTKSELKILLKDFKLSLENKGYDLSTVANLEESFLDSLKTTKIENSKPTLDERIQDWVHNKSNKADRHNKGKLQWHLVNMKALEPLVKVMESGAIKYGEDNWMKGLERKEILNSMQRHMNALREGELFDSESGLHHCGHILANAMFLSNFSKEEWE